MHDCL